MQQLLRRLAQPVLWWLYRRYNRQAHWVQVDGLQIHLGPGVFHPRWFLTTKTFTKFALTQIEAGNEVLELGAGNGRLALNCSRAGAQVTASDINPVAIDSLQKSAVRNELALAVILSDLFASITKDHFDYIFINPPYFPRQPKNDQERAFLCGEDFEYFKQLFKQLTAYHKSTIFMILTNACDLDSIATIAEQHGSQMQLGSMTNSWGEEHLIYQIYVQDK